MAEYEKGSREESKMRSTLRKAKVEWLKWVLGYAWGLRALSNAAKMKQAAEHRGKASIQDIIISQQSSSEEKKENK